MQGVEAKFNEGLNKQKGLWKSQPLIGAVTLSWNGEEVNEFNH